MAVKTVGEHYRCNVCGNEVKVIKVGRGSLFCCGQEMSLFGATEQKPVDDEIPV
ncbi:desulfoferrodoxin FeS4 iron-binding domain-containing protein [Candidatus Microgenomates bacterium]|jgi:superoxide reductase|nr:MAG: desulfoferrodoxin FeS4 iron-binding domain-containing protein [Candidatus Microgenomates bacterium]